MVALTISSVLVVLIGTVFLVQNQVYGRQLQRSGAHDNARIATEAVAAELRSTVAGGLVVARSDSLTVRTPMSVAAVCATDGSYAYVQSEDGVDGLDLSEVAGFAVRDDATGTWSFYNVGWSTFSAGTTDAAAACAANGADTVGATAEFLRLESLAGYHGSIPEAGSLLMIFRETTFRFRASSMDSTAVALYRRAYGGTALEFVTGMDTTAAFSYRLTGRSSYRDQVGGAQLETVDAVQIVADARQRSTSGTLDDLTFGWSVTVPLRNVR